MVETENKSARTKTSIGTSLVKRYAEQNNDTAVEVVTFAGTLALAYFSGWHTKDLIWSLWLSSLSIGFLSVLVSGGRRVIRPDATIVERILSFAGTIGAIGLFTLHFGTVHYVYASILDLLMPLMDHPGRVYIGQLTWRGGTSFAFWETLSIAIVQYWPVVLLNAARDRSTVLSSSVMTGKEIGPYLAILKLHFIVIGLGACYALGVDTFPVYAAVYTLLYSPAKTWKTIFRRRRAEDRENLRTQSTV